MALNTPKQQSELLCGAYKMKTYTFYQDPSHGWLKVPKIELETLGISDKISKFSYQYGKSAYLEEDCDLALFFNAKGWQGTREFWDSGIISNKHTNKRSIIRSYQPYFPGLYIKPKIGDKIELIGCFYKSALWIAKKQIKTEDGKTWRVTPRIIGSKIEG